MSNCLPFFFEVLKEYVSDVKDFPQERKIKENCEKSEESKIGNQMYLTTVAPRYPVTASTIIPPIMEAVFWSHKFFLFHTLAITEFHQQQKKNVGP